MANIIFVFVLAAFALQGTNSAALTKQNVLGHVVQELSQELQSLATDVNGQLLHLTEEFADEFNKILEEANFDQIFEDLRKEVASFTSEEFSIDFCKDTADKDIQGLENYVQVHTFTCKYQVDGEFDGLKSKLETLLQRVRNLNTKFPKEVFSCMLQSQGSSNAFGVCLNEKVENLKFQIEDLKKVILDTLTEVESALDFVKDKVSKCVLSAKKEVTEMAQVIVNKMKTCVENANKPELYMTRGGLWEIMDKLTEQVNKFTSQLTTRTLELVKSFAEKFNQVVKEANFENIITQLRKEVAEISSENTSLNYCEEAAISEVELLNKLIKEHTFSCKYEVDSDFDALSKAFKVAFKHLVKLNAKISQDFYSCMKESHGNEDKLSSCLEPKIETIIVDLEEVEKEVLKTLDEAEKSFDLIMGKVSKCVLEAKKDVENKAQLIIDNMKTCVQNSAATQQRNVPAIQNYYKDLANKIQAVTVKLPQEITTFSDNVNIVVSDHNIDVLIVKIKEQIEELLAASTKDTTECKLEVTPKVDLLVSDSQAALVQCVADVQLVADDLEKQFQVLEKKSAALADELNSNILECAQEYPKNIVGFAKCLSERTISLKNKVVELQEEVDRTVALALETTKEAVQSLTKCMNEVEDQTATKSQLIIEDLQKCIRNLDLLF